VQLSRATQRLWLALRSRRFAAPLGALAILVALASLPGSAGVLPEDEMDAMYHRYEGGGVTVQGPSVLIRKKIGENFSASYNYYVDAISSASIDVLLSASPYKETRTQHSVSLDYQHGKTTYSVGYIHSREPDYIANTSVFSLSQDMFGDLTTVRLSYSRGWDQVYRDIKLTDGALVNDPTFAQRLDHRSYGVGLTQVLTRNLLLSLNFQTLTDQGYLANPYRKVLFLDPTQGTGFGLEDQVYPGTHTSNATSADLKYYLPYRAALDGSYRYYTDTWGITAHTVQLGYTQPWEHWTFDGTFRYYKQNAADFYSDLFPRRDAQNFMARDRELAAFSSYTVGVGASYEFHVPRAPWIQKSTLNLHYDRLMIDYSDYRNATLINPLAGVLAGEEPLYKLDANIIQLYYSLYF
jgi:Protein of unknown function (DUF3570)